MKIHLIHAAFSALTLNALGLLSAQAQGTSAVTFPAPTDTGLAPTRLTLGYEFTVSTAMQATALSFYDAGADGLALSHPVGLWSNVFNLGTTTAQNLATVTVATGSPIQDSFRYVTLNTPVALSPGVTYTLGAFTSSDGQNASDQIFKQVANATFAPGFTFVRALTSSDTSSLTVPTQDQSLLGTSYFGPGILLAPIVTIPEPSTWLVLLGGACGLATVRRRRSARRA